MKIKSLNRSWYFKRMYFRGTSSVEPSLVLYFMKNNLGYNRLGITVSKKIGKAVKRNRAKRRLKETYIKYASHIKNGYDIIMVARVRTCTVDFGELGESFVKLLKKNKIYQYADVGCANLVTLRRNG